jgi:hypothetical protein
LNNGNVETFLLFLPFNFIYAREEKERKTFTSRTKFHVYAKKNNISLFRCIHKDKRKKVNVNEFYCKGSIFRLRIDCRKY